MNFPRRRHGRWTPSDRAASIYRYVSFDLPSGTEGVEVTLEYDRSSAVIDLGIFDPNGGFRGYSGGVRDRFRIGLRHATPGYLPGPLRAGEWRVLLGLYRIPDEGVDWEMTIDVGSVTLPTAAEPPPLEPGPQRRRLPASAGRSWLRGDLHSHTVHSDGRLTIDELASRARLAGLDFLAVTDHNTVSHHPHLASSGARYGVELIPGQEVTTHRGHANCLGPSGWVDFRAPADRWLDQARAQRALFSINHPVDPAYGWHLELTGPPHLVEIWHGTWDRHSSEPIDWWQRAGGVPVGGSDFHSPLQGDRLAFPTTLVDTGEEGILAALAEGRVALAADPEGSVLVRVEGELLVVADQDRPLRLVGPGGEERLVGGGITTIPGAGPGLYLLVDEQRRVQALVP